MKIKRWNTDRKIIQNSGGKFYHLEALLAASNHRAMQDNTLIVVGGIN